MLYLRQNKTKVIYSDLLGRLDNANIIVGFSFLLVIINDMTNDLETTIIPSTNINTTNINSNLSYYPLSITTLGNPNPLLSEIKLKNTGYHTYKIYYQSNTSNNKYPIPTNIDSFEVENGKALVYNAISEVSYKEQANGNPNNFIYVP
jgi:hypothetical protein